MAEMRRCIGSAKFGIGAHEAPIGDFPAQPSQKDGLGRMCKAHWTQYTGALRKAAVARKAAEGGTVERITKAAKAAGAKVTVKPVSAKPARRSKVEHPMAHVGRKAPKPGSTKGKEAKAALAAIDALPGTESVKAIGTDEAQAALDVVNAARGFGEEGTFESDVRAILA